jgi:predicted amidophosphoribosyltransferase
VPHWLAVAVMSVLPVLAIGARRRRRDPSICATCGYDLRATPQRCPECGRESVHA